MMLFNDGSLAVLEKADLSPSAMGMGQRRPPRVGPGALQYPSLSIVSRPEDLGLLSASQLGAEKPKSLAAELLPVVALMFGVPLLLWVTDYQRRKFIRTTRSV